MSAAFSYFDELGARIGQLWDGQRASFAAVALECLRADHPCEHVTFDDLARHIATSTELVEQHDLGATFGQPPVTVFAGDGFYIALLVWFDGVTTVHSHSFVGAFGVVAGSSLHTRYRFDSARSDDGVDIGALEPLSIELLEPGDARSIDPDLVHSLFHLSRPSLSIVVRTPGVDEQVQLQYIPPGLAFNPFQLDPAIERQAQLVASMLFAGFDVTEVALDIVRATGVRASLRLTQLLASSDGVCDRSRVFASVRERHGATGAAIADAAVGTLRRSNTISRRRVVVEPAHRFLLAVLTMACDRAQALALIGQFQPEVDPLDTLETWLGELADVPCDALFGPSVLGIALTSDVIAAIRGLLDGRDVDPRLALILPRTQILAKLFS